MNLSFPSLKYERDFMFLSSLGLFFIVIGSAFVITLLNSAPKEEFCGFTVAQLGIIVIFIYLTVGSGTLVIGINRWWNSDYRQKRKIGDEADKLEERKRKEKIEPIKEGQASMAKESEKFEDKKSIKENLESGDKDE